MVQNRWEAKNDRKNAGLKVGQWKNENRCFLGSSRTCFGPRFSGVTLPESRGRGPSFRQPGRANKIENQLH